MTEKLNTSNISTIKTNIKDPTGIKSIANGVINRHYANAIVVQHSERPNEFTKKIRSTIESLLNCQINERVNNQYIFFRWVMPHISDVGDKYIAMESSIVAVMENGMTVADPKNIEKWIVEVMVCTTKQSALTEKDMALKARVSASDGKNLLFKQI